MPEIVNDKLVANPKNRPDMTKEIGESAPTKVENKVNADKGTPEIVPAENRIVTNTKFPNTAKEVDKR